MLKIFVTDTGDSRDDKACVPMSESNSALPSSLSALQVVGVDRVRVLDGHVLPLLCHAPLSTLVQILLLTSILLSLSSLIER
eukprot:6199027-Pleurochrysis_carterae.AAC.3